MIQETYEVYKNKSVEQRKKEFEDVLEFSNKKYHNGKQTPLYAHAQNFWNKDKLCQGASDKYQDY